MGLIYKIACESSGKCYVGQTTQLLEKRINQHLYNSKNKLKNYAIYNAIRKYGWENFKVEILEDNISLEDLNEKELFFTNKFNALAPNGYVLVAGNGKEKIISKNVRNKIALASRNITEDTRKKMSNAKKNKKLSTRTKEKMSQNSPFLKKILCYDLDDNFIKEYNSLTIASKDLKLDLSHISKVCRGKLNKTGLYKFKYKTNNASRNK